MAEDLAFLDRCLWLEEPPESSRQLGFGGVTAPALPAPFFHCHQVHGTRILTAGTGPLAASPEQADGIVTRVKGFPIAVKTADCLPLLGATSSLAAAVHCGWRSLTGGILTALLTEPEPLHAWRFYLGPSIQSPRFEVGPDVVAALASPALGLTPLQTALTLTKGRRGDRWHADLQVAACLVLKNLGIAAEQITVLRLCTYECSDYHSFRRDGQNSGRNYSWITLESGHGKN